MTRRPSAPVHTLTFEVVGDTATEIEDAADAAIDAYLTGHPEPDRWEVRLSIDLSPTPSPHAGRQTGDGDLWVGIATVVLRPPVAF